MRTEIAFSNRTSERRALCIEPWSGVWEVEPGEKIVVAIDSPSAPVLEWEWGHDAHTDMLAVHDPAGTSIDVLRDGVSARCDR